MMTLNTSKRLTIFEGPDGAGKTTAALKFAADTGARYVHFGPLFHVSTGVARMYVEAMMPALLGYQDVVFDRSWLSEKPYGDAFRQGQDRMGPWGRAMLERLAMRCATIVVKCDPGWDTIINSYENRGDREEMLTNGKQLWEVYDAYDKMKTSLLTLRYNFTDPDARLLSDNLAESNWRTKPHNLDHPSAGNLEAKIVLVGESFAEWKNDDAWYQWPFASFNAGGCSQWLTRELIGAGVSENELLWLNADMLPEVVMEPNQYTYIALGKTAQAKLIKHGFGCHLVPHPQHHKRFGKGEPYLLIELLKGLT